jgi:hypothetical protein
MFFLKDDNGNALGNPVIGDGLINIAQGKNNNIIL